MASIRVKRQSFRLGAVASLALVVFAAACGSAARRTASQPAGAAASPAESIVAEIPLPSYGAGIAVTPDGMRAFVAGMSGVFVVDTVAHRVLTTIDVGDTPHAIAMAPDGRHAWVMDFMSRNVVTLDTVKDNVAARIPIGTRRRPRLSPSIAASRDGLRVYAADAANDDLLIIDAAKSRVLHTRFVDVHPGGIAVSPAGDRVYVVGCRLSCTDGELLVLDAANGEAVQRIALGGVPSGLALSPDGRKAYVPHGRDAMVSAVDLTSATAVTIPVDAKPTDAAVGPNGLVYIASIGPPGVTVLEPRTRTVVGRIPLTQPPRALAISPDGRKAYVTHQGSVCSVLALDRWVASPSR